MQTLVPIRRAINTLMNHLDALDKFVMGLKKKQILPTPEVKRHLRTLRDIVQELLWVVGSQIHSYCVTSFTARYLECCVVGYWAMGKREKAIRAINRVLDSLDEPNRNHSALFHVAQYPVLLAEAQRADVLSRFIRVIGWYTELPLAMAIHTGAKAVWETHFGDGKNGTQ